jgi:ribosomal-protein-alanine N-acetyltransferase
MLPPQHSRQRNVYYFVEPMAEDDIADVQRVEHECFSTPWSPNTYRRELRHTEMSRYLVARASPTPPPPLPQQGQTRRNSLLGALLAPFARPVLAAPKAALVGYAGVWVTLDEGHVTTIAVHPGQRGRSVGELLLNGLIDQGLELGAANLTLEVRVSNNAAQQLYLKYGFQPVGTRKRYYTDNGEDALIMWTDTISSAAYQSRLRELRQQLFARLRAHAEPRRSEPGEESSRAYPT